jgi:hypothetical protein
MDSDFFERATYEAGLRPRKKLRFLRLNGTAEIWPSQLHLRRNQLSHSTCSQHDDPESESRERSSVAQQLTLVHFILSQMHID